MIYQIEDTFHRRMKLGKHWKAPWGRRQNLRSGMWKLKGDGKVADLLLVVEDGLEAAGGSGGLPVEISGMLPNKLF